MEDKYYTESHKKAIDRYDKDFNNTEKNVHNKADSNSKKAYAFAIPAVVIALLLIAFIGIALTGSVKKAVKKSAITNNYTEISNKIYSYLDSSSYKELSDYSDENRTYNTRWFMNLYKNDEYGRAVDYASRDKIVIDNIQDNELDESIAVAEYYNAEFYKNVYKTMGNTQKLKQMEEQSDMALKRMGSLSILKQKIDSIVNVPDRQTK